jgi:hypothetical protein
MSKKEERENPWSRKSMSRDMAKTRKIKSIFLIYCEGANTEPEYFKSFPVNTETQVEALGLGRSRLALVKHILGLVKKKGLLAGQANYDPERQIWCVFDRDERYFPGEDRDFDAAVVLALQNGIRVAWSNDSFELWLYLHDAYIDNKVLRVHFYKHLSKRLSLNYEKEGKAEEFCRSLYGKFIDRQAAAIRHASRLEKFHKEVARPSLRNPCTTIHRLVAELNKCLKR